MKRMIPMEIVTTNVYRKISCAKCGGRTVNGAICIYYLTISDLEIPSMNN